MDSHDLKQQCQALECGSLAPMAQQNHRRPLDFSLPAQLPGQAASSPIKTTRGNLKDVLYAQFISPYLATIYQDVYRQLAQLLKSKGQEQVLTTLTTVGYNVRNLVPIVEAATQPMIYVDIGRQGCSQFPLWELVFFMY